VPAGFGTVWDGLFAPPPPPHSLLPLASVSASHSSACKTASGVWNTLSHPGTHFVCALVQADAVLECLDHDGDGALDYVEFLSAFKIVDTKTGHSTTPVSTASPTGDRAF
jgi:hypothetical protein